MHQSGDLIHANMQFEVHLHVGSLYYKLQPMDPVTELTPPFRTAMVTDELVHFDTSFCNVEDFPMVHKCVDTAPCLSLVLRSSSNMDSLHVVKKKADVATLQVRFLLVPVLS